MQWEQCPSKSIDRLGQAVSIVEVTCNTWILKLYTNISNTFTFIFTPLIFFIFCFSVAKESTADVDNKLSIKLFPFVLTFVFCAQLHVLLTVNLSFLGGGESGMWRLRVLASTLKHNYEPSTFCTSYLTLANETQIQLHPAVTRCFGEQ